MRHFAIFLTAVALLTVDVLNAQTGSYDAAKAVAVDDSGNVYVTGASVGNGAGVDFVTIKYDPSGKQLWVARYDAGAGADVAQFVIAGKSGVLYVSGWSKGSSTGYDFAVVKYAPGVTKTEEPPSLPKEYALEQNYPNPFNSSTTIRFSLPQRSHVTLKVLDVLGREVATLVDGEMEAGEHTVIYNAKDLASGVYFYQLQAGSLIQQRKMEVLK